MWVADTISVSSGTKKTYLGRFIVFLRPDNSANVSMQELTGSERSMSERYINVLMAAAVFTQSVLATDVSPEHEEVKTTQNTT